MAKDVPIHLHLGEVYDLASEIGKEFEKFIDAYGTEAVKQLMTKIIVTLEYLESSSMIIENLQDELYDSKAKVKQLEYEKVEKAEFKNKFDQDLELIEENWKKEIDYLNSLVFKLQEENKRLCSSIANKESQSPNFSKVLLSDEDLDVIQKLKVVADHHRTQVLDKDKELLQKSNDLDKFQIETERLAKVNKELSHKNEHLRKQLHILIDEKSDLQVYIQGQRKEFQELQRQLVATIKENNDLSVAEGMHNQHFKEKLIIDDDPNRPRITVEELRNILSERDDLKAKINDLEDQLSLLKLKCSPKSDSTLKELHITPGDYELPVQGPINREPEDKLFPDKKGHGIRKFFRFLRRFSVDSPVPIMPFSASPLSTGQILSNGSTACV